MPSNTNRTYPTGKPGLPARRKALAEEQRDERGDILWTLTVLGSPHTVIGSTHDRNALDRVADQLGCDLVFAPAGRGAA